VQAILATWDAQVVFPLKLSNIFSARQVLQQRKPTHTWQLMPLAISNLLKLQLQLLVDQ